MLTSFAEEECLNPVKYDRNRIEEQLNERLKRDHDTSEFTVVGKHQAHDRRKPPPSPDKCEDGVHIWVSQTSTTWMKGNQATHHYIDEKYAVDTPVGPDSGSRINRVLIGEIVYPKHRIRWGDRDRALRKPPRLAIPGDYHEMSHLDLKACYFNIIRIVGVYPELDWERQRFGVWDRVDDWYPYAEHKLVRNSMYGMVFQPTLLHINSRGRKTIRPEDNKKIVNPALHQLVMIIVNDIGRFAEKLGSPYWHTDGGLVPQMRAREFYDYVGDTWGLPVVSTIGEGEATVYGPGRWWYEDHPCLAKGHQERRVRAFEEEFEGAEWLKRRMSYWVARRGNPEVIYKKPEKEAVRVKTEAEIEAEAEAEVEAEEVANAEALERDRETHEQRYRPLHLS